MLIYLTIFVIVLCFIEYFVNHGKKAKCIKTIPGFPDHFILGNALSFVTKCPVKLFQLARKYAAEFKGIYRFYCLGIAAVCIYNPEDVEIVISSMKHHEKSLIYNFLKPWLKDGLLVSGGAKWQERRKILTTAFHFNVLRMYFPILEDNSNRLRTVLEGSKGESIDVVRLLSEYTLNSICETAMGVQLDSNECNMGREYKNAVHGTIKLLLNRFTSLILYSDTIYNLSPEGNKQWRYLSIIHQFSKKIINLRKKNLKDKPLDYDVIKDGYEEYGYKPKKKAAMLDLLVSAQKNGLIDDRGIQEEVDTFMFEGHDTTASGLTYCLLALAENQEIQDKVARELQDIFNDSTRMATPDDLSRMTYLEMCIKEGLRLYPPVPFISRKLSEDAKLSSYTVPKGTMCHIHIFDLHRQESIYKDALKFNPDRFSMESSTGRHNFAYIPFSAGPRNCIGQKFAMMEMKSALSAIFRHFKVMPITTQQDLEFSADLVLRNSKPIYLKFIKIT